MLDIEKELDQELRLNSDSAYPAIKKSDPDRLRASYSRREPNAPSGKIEIVRKGAKYFRKAAGKYNPLLVEEPRELYADKIVATLGRMAGRGSIKATDLFDLEYLDNQLNSVASEQDTEEKAKDYGYNGWNKHTVEKVLSYIIDPRNLDAFARDLEKTMMPDYFLSRTFDKRFFDESARHFEGYRHI